MQHPSTQVLKWLILLFIVIWSDDSKGVNERLIRNYGKGLCRKELCPEEVCVCVCVCVCVYSTEQKTSLCLPQKHFLLAWFQYKFFYAISSRNFMFNKQIQTQSLFCLSKSVLNQILSNKKLIFQKFVQFKVIYCLYRKPSFTEMTNPLL